VENVKKNFSSSFALNFKADSQGLLPRNVATAVSEFELSNYLFSNHQFLFLATFRSSINLVYKNKVEKIISLQSFRRVD